MTAEDRERIRLCSECHQPFTQRSATKPELTCCAAHQRNRVARRQRENRQRRQRNQAGASVRLRIVGAPAGPQAEDRSTAREDDLLAHLRQLHHRLGIQTARLLYDDRQGSQTSGVDFQQSVGDMLGTAVQLLEALDDVLSQ